MCIYAQTITGTVTSNNNEPISFANISVLNTDFGTSTNEKGEFSIQLEPGAYQLFVQALGFASKIEPITLTGGGNSKISITLTPKTSTLDEIYVTAQKRERALLKTPISVTALSSVTIEQTQTWELNDLTGVVPNYNYSELSVGFQPIQSIRGVQVFSKNPALATYVDGVNSLDILANGFALTDIERIEVLRGPQGTLFGRNAMGGVINIITKEPTNRQSGFFESSIGNLNLQRYAIGLKSPIVDNKLFFGISGLFERQGGYMQVDTTGVFAPEPDVDGEAVGNEDRFYGNAYLKWLVSPIFSATLNVKAQTDGSNASGFFVSPSTEARAENAPDRVDIGRIGEHRRNIVNTSLTLNYFGDGFNLSSVSSYQSIGLSYSDIQSGGVFHSYNDGRIGGMADPQQVVTQEFKYTTNSPTSILQTTVGIFGFYQNAFEPTTNLAFELAPDTYSIFRNEGSNVGAAAFGEVEYSITPKLSIITGFRFDYEYRENTFNGFGDLADVNGQLIETRPDTTVDGEYTALSPKLAVTYSLTDNANIFASYTRGFRAGGVNAQRLPDGIDQTFDPEYSDNFEFGVKSSLLNQSGYIAANLFFINWTDLQFFSEVAPVTFARGNVGDAVSYGAELESSIIPIQNLQLDASIGLNLTEYRDFVLGTTNPQDISGNRLSNAPEFTSLLAAQYLQPIKNTGSLFYRTEIRGVGSYFTDIQNTIDQDAYALINLRFGYQNEVFEAYLWIQNLTDERFLVYGSPDSSGGNIRALASSPRTLGITLKTNF